MIDVFDPVQVLQILHRHDVRYVVIGGFAATAYGSHLPTTDVAITPERTRENLSRLSSALLEMNARIRAEAVPQELSSAHDGASLQRISVVNLVTNHGDLDLVMDPAGGATYAQLASRALVVQLHGVAVPLAALEDVSASKRAANLPQDWLALPILEELQARRDRPGAIAGDL